LHRPDAVWLSVAIGLGLAVRLYFVSQPMRYDEAFSFLAFADRDWQSVFYYPLPNNHVLHTVLVRATTILFGTDPAAVRLPAFLAGLAAIPMIFVICRQLLPGSRAGILAASASAVFPYLVLYGTMSRGYALMVLLFLASISVGLRLTSAPGPWHCAALGCISALGLFTIPSMLFAVLGVYLWVTLLLLQRFRSIRPAVRGFLLPCAAITVLLTGVLYFPVAWINGGISPIVANRFVIGLPYAQFIARLGPHLVETFRDFSRDVPLAVQAGVALLALVGLHAAFRNRRFPALLLFPCLLAASTLLLFSKHSIPFARTWIFFLPVVFILADLGLTAASAALAPKWQALPATACLLLAASAAFGLTRSDAIAAYPDTGSFPEAEQIVGSMAPLLAPGDKVQVRLPADMPLYYYMRRHGVPRANRRPAEFASKAADSFFVVKKSAYSIRDLTSEKVVLILDLGDAAVYRRTGL
jgi:hypothetical protein